MDNTLQKTKNTYVISVGEDFHNFLQKARVIKTGELRTLISLPFTFEQIDDTQDYIIRPFKKQFTKDTFYQELRKDFI